MVKLERTKKKIEIPFLIGTYFVFCFFIGLHFWYVSIKLLFI